MPAWPDRQYEFLELHTTLVRRWGINDKLVIDILSELEQDRITAWGVGLVTKLVESVIQHRNQQIAEPIKQITQGLEPVPPLPITPIRQDRQLTATGPSG